MLGDQKTDRVTKWVGLFCGLGTKKVLFPRDRRRDSPLLGDDNQDPFA